jgi:precorrin-4/cobalt-precorrin-4 C11-methyltransferase
MTVYFIGAGPGDPELITVKGQRLIRSCPVIIYAGSLVPAAVLQGHQAEQVVNSAELHLEQIIDLIKTADAKARTWLACTLAIRACMAPSASRFATCANSAFL